MLRCVSGKVNFDNKLVAPVANLGKADSSASPSSCLHRRKANARNDSFFPDLLRRLIYLY